MISDNGEPNHAILELLNVFDPFANIVFGVYAERYQLALTRLEFFFQFRQHANFSGCHWIETEQEGDNYLNSEVLRVGVWNQANGRYQYKLIVSSSTILL